MRRSNMKRNNWIYIVILGIFAWMIYNEHFNTPTPGVVPAATRSTARHVVTDSYALRASDNNWPKLASDAPSVLLDDLNRKNYYLVFDGSDSMNASECSGGRGKIDVAKQAVAEFINNIPGDANIGMAVFDHRGLDERILLGPSSKNQARTEIQGILARGGTPLRSAITLAYQSLQQQAVRQLGYGEYHLVVITDGHASKGEDPGSVVDDIIRNSPVVLHTIGFCIAGDHVLNQTGLTLYRSANNPADLARGLESVLAEAADFSTDQFDGTLP